MKKDRRTRLLEFKPEFADKLLDKIWDPAILGWAYNSHTKIETPAYGYQVMKAIALSEKMPAETIHLVLDLIEKRDAVILKRMSYKPLVNRINKSGLKAWEMLDRAAVGVNFGSVCYLDDLCMDILRESGTKLPGETDMEEEIRIRDQFEKTIKCADLGDGSPTFITVIK